MQQRVVAVTGLDQHATRPLFPAPGPTGAARDLVEQLKAALRRAQIAALLPGRVLAIGGNVRGTVSLKLLPATFERRGEDFVPTSVGRGSRNIFAHLKLRAAPVEVASSHSPP